MRVETNLGLEKGYLKSKLSIIDKLYVMDSEEVGNDIFEEMIKPIENEPIYSMIEKASSAFYFHVIGVKVIISYISKGHFYIFNKNDRYKLPVENDEITTYEVIKTNMKDFYEFLESKLPDLTIEMITGMIKAFVKTIVGRYPNEEELEKLIGVPNIRTYILLQFFPSIIE